MLLLACALQSVSAGDMVSDFAAKVAKSCVSFDYAFKYTAEAPVTGSGGVVLQQNCYKMIGGGMEIWSDGKTRWTVDHSAREAYIEAVETSNIDYISNPSALIMAVGSVFTQSAASPAVFNGKSVTSVTLHPSVSDTGLQSVLMYFGPSTLPVGLVATLDDGTKVTITLKNFTLDPISKQSFSFDMSRLGNSYFVTDLR